MKQIAVRKSEIFIHSAVISWGKYFFEKTNKEDRTFTIGREERNCAMIFSNRLQCELDDRISRQ